ncbi:SOH1-domain-containing protein [Rhodotorula diobovata]|uniref:Mediator of RNA polymerase II transcription subunit 31 n=1 Tax=Rhodotorula diobovata TaxID=5288 RepID=A0A5C5FN17_9BASI|nr:SOH1-domain-containing protein [Rhodotorula diobovata]
MASVAPSPAPAPFAPPPQQREANRIRFETELEFVQCLANPFYLQSLAQQGLFDSEPFLNYLTYLLYFRRPSYARFLQYPQSLHHLSLLTAPGAPGEAFRRALKEDGLLAQDLAGAQIAHWAGWREREGVRPGQAEGAPNGVAPAAGGVNGAGAAEGTAT